MSEIALRLRCWQLGCRARPLCHQLATSAFVRSALTWCAGLLCVLIATPATSAPRGEAAMDRKTREEAIESIPFDRLSDAAQTKLWQVVSKPSIYRQLPTTVVESDPDMYLFLVRYPEVIVNMWQLMGVTKVQVTRTDDYTFEASDGAGTACDVELIYGDHKTHVFYGEGSYEGPLLKRLIRGTCVMVLRSDFAQTEDQHIYATSRLDMFVRFDNVGAEILAKTLHPLVGKSADHNFKESTRFLGQVSQAAETRATGVHQLANRLNNIRPAVRDKFVEISTTVHRRATSRDAGNVVWGDDREATPVSVAPVVTRDAVLRGAGNLFETPTRKPLRLRR